MNIYLIINYLRLLLFPLSILYGIIISFRNFLYDSNILFKYKSKYKIISVGNINTGGSGKTPLVIKLAEILLERGCKIAIISRGYKRKSKGMQIVFDNKKINLTVSDAGDEPYMTAELLKRKSNNFYLIVSEDRTEAIRYIEQNFKPDYIILDDAYQQRKIFKDYDFLVIDTNNFEKHRLFNKILLPAGNLREPLKNIRRCTVIFQNNKFSDKSILDFINKYNKPVYTIRYRINGIYNRDYKITEENLDKVIAFCGIADPESFKKSLENFNIKEFITFPDHKKYNNIDIENLIKKYIQGYAFITTEKDFVKIRNFNNFIENYPVYFIRLSVEIERENELINFILNYK